MQKFVFSRTVYAANEYKARLAMAEILGVARVEHGDKPMEMLEYSLGMRQIARKPPFEKPGTVYYAIRLNGEGPKLGAVMLLSRDGRWNRGICIVGLGDVFNSVEARRRTWQRARKAAWVTHQNTEPINWKTCPFLSAYMSLPGNSYADTDVPIWKSEHNCELTPYEKHLLSGKGDVS